MQVSSIFFLSLILLVFASLDIFMLVSLLKPGDERNQIIVWKAATLTLLGQVGANILDIIEGVLRSQSIATNALTQLEVAAILYFISLLYYKRKLGG